MKAFKAYFLSRLLREKIFFTGFVLLIAIWWLSHVVSRVSHFCRDFGGTSSILNAQRSTLAERPEVESQVKAALAQLDPAHTLDSARLQGELNTLASGFPNMQIDARPSNPTDEFSVHSVQFSVRKADWAALQHFYVELSKRTPYISIEQCSISADRTNPAQLNATMLISSVEIAK
jgi:hypothetical protein